MEDVPTFSSVWDAIEDSPMAAANMRLRSEWMIALRGAVEAWQLSPVAAAERLGVTAPRLAELLRGRIGRFTLDALVEMAGRADLSVRLELTAAE